MTFARAALLAMGLAGCTAVRDTWRPEGDGGWTPSERRAAVSALAPSAGVVDPRAPRPTPSEPHVYDLRGALARAAQANRAIAAAGTRTEIARQQALEARGLLLPSTTAKGAYTWYSDVRSTQPELGPGSPPIKVVLSDSNAGTINALFVQPIDLFPHTFHVETLAVMIR